MPEDKQIETAAPDARKRRAIRAEDMEPEWVEALEAADFSHLDRTLDDLMD